MSRALRAAGRLAGWVGQHRCLPVVHLRLLVVYKWSIQTLHDARKLIDRVDGVFSVQFWKFAITGADNNREIKIWACETWVCLQTIRFMPNVQQSPSFADARLPPPVIKARLDLSANYLVLTDINRKALYVLQLYRDSDTSRASVTCVSEFLLTQPCLSFAISDTSLKRVDTSQNLTTGQSGSSLCVVVLQNLPILACTHVWMLAVLHVCVLVWRLQVKLMTLTTVGVVCESHVTPRSS